MHVAVDTLTQKTEVASFDAYFAAGEKAKEEPKEVKKEEKKADKKAEPARKAEAERNKKK